MPRGKRRMLGTGWRLGRLCGKPRVTEQEPRRAKSNDEAGEDAPPRCASAGRESQSEQRGGGDEQEEQGKQAHWSSPADPPMAASDFDVSESAGLDDCGPFSSMGDADAVADEPGRAPNLP